MKKMYLLFLLCLLSLPDWAGMPRVCREKIYLAFDRDFVRFGDTLVVSGLLTESSGFSQPYSRYVQIELLDSRDSVLVRQKLPCGSGLFRTRIPIDVYPAPGIYYVRAYTRLMRNFPTWTFPIRPVGIGQAPELPGDKASEEIQTVRFYPEGGRLVAGVPQQLVYEVKDTAGNPLIALGELVDEKDSILISRLESFSDGKGTIRFIPRLGATYALRLRNPRDGRKSDYKLPAADTVPSLQMNINRARLRYSLTAAATGEEKYRFALFFRGNFILEDTLSTRHPSGILDITGYPSGLYAGILLQAADSVLAERLILGWKQEPPVPSALYLPQTVYKPGDTVAISLSPADSSARYLVRLEEKQPCTDCLTAALPEEPSVARPDTLLPDRPLETLSSYFYLFSDLEEPLIPSGSLFNAQGEIDLKAVDRLLVTCRWKAYSLPQAWQDRLFFPYPPETMLTLSGRVESELGRPLKKGGTVVALDNHTGFTYISEITPDSRFRMGVDDFPEGHSFFMQAYDHKGKSYNLKIIPDNATYPGVQNRLKNLYEPGKRRNAETETNIRGEITFSYDKDNRKNYHLPEIEVSARVHKAEPKLNRIFEPFKITEEQIDQFTYPDIIPLLERMVGFKVKKVSLDPSDTSDDPMNFRYGIFSTRGVSVMRGSEDPHDYQPGEMPIILDGVLTDTHQVITLYPPQVIRSIERLTPAKALAYTSVAMNGALLIKTRGWKETEFVSKGIHYMPEGLSPLALPPPSLPCTVRVPDKEGVYLIVAEGIDGEGNPRRFTREIRVAR